MVDSTSASLTAISKVTFLSKSTLYSISAEAGDLASLPAVAQRITDRHAVQTTLLQRIADRRKFCRLNDGDDQTHAGHIGETNHSLGGWLLKQAGLRETIEIGARRGSQALSLPTFFRRDSLISRSGTRKSSDANVLAVKQSFHVAQQSAGFRKSSDFRYESCG